MMRPLVSRPGSRLLRLAALTGLLCLTLFPGGCVSELPETAALSDVGVVTGQVREAGLGVPARVRFRLRDQPSLAVDVTVAADSTGWYRAELPLGLYELEFSLPGSYGNSRSAQDTLLVGRTERRRDFERGRLRLTVRVPDAFDGSYANVEMNRSTQRASQQIRVVGGTAAFDLRVVPPMTSVVSLRFGSDMDSFYLPGTYNARQADSLRVGPTQVESDVDLRARHMTMSGRVTGSWQQSPSASMRVIVAEPGSSWRGASTECDPDGSWRLDLFVPGSKVLKTACTNVEQWFGDGTQAGATVYDLQPGQHLTGLDLVEGGLRVHFVGPGLIADNVAAIDLRRSDGRATYRLYGWENPVTIANLAPGTYHLYVHGYCFEQPWQPQWFDAAGDEAAATPVDIVAGVQQDLTVTLVSGGRVSGYLTNGVESVPDYIDVRIHDDSGTWLCDSSINARRGRLLIDGLPDGTYCLSVSRWDFGSWWFPGTTDLDAAVRLVITDGSAIDGLVWPLPTQPEGKQR